MPSRPPWRRAACLWALACILPAAPALHAQPHEASQGGYTLRSSTVVSTRINPGTARAHGITPAADLALLNVVVLRQTAQGSETAPAEVQAEAVNLAGMQRPVEMREARAPNGDVSYVGTYRFAPREVLDLRVQARPRAGGPALSLRYRERMP